MQKHFIFLLIMSFISIMPVSAYGVDDQNNPNDPNINDRANACFEGGNMEGKCDTDWEWMCGWHIIRITDGQDLDERATFPQGCVSLLPPLIQDRVADTIVSSPIYSTSFGILRITGAINTSPNVNFYDATGTFVIVEGTMVQAVNQATADTLCANILAPRSITSLGALLAGGTLPSDYWFCSYSP